MNYPEYRDDLQRIHESEVYGLAVFSTAARCTRDAERRKKWLMLTALEKKTLKRYLQYMSDSGQPVVEPTAWRLRGHVEGAALGVLPWRVAMRLVRSATGPFQERFLRLEQHAEDEHREFFAYVYAHEKAIEAFADKELTRDRDSLADVKHLLEGSSARRPDPG